MGSDDRWLDREGRFWLGTWIVVGVVIVCLSAMSLFHFHKKNKLMLSAIQSGANPIEVRYVFCNSTISQDVLTILNRKINENGTK